MAQNTDFNNIIVWGGANEDKTNNPVRWNHDYIINASCKDKVAKLPDPTVLIPLIFDCSIEEIKVTEIFEGFDEYEKDNIKVEAIHGWHYTEYKLFGKDIDFNIIFNRITGAGIEHKKPDFTLHIKGIPEEIDPSKLETYRYNYKSDILDKDNTTAKNKTVMSIVKGVFGTVFFAAILTYLSMEVFMPKYVDITPAAEGFIAQKGVYITFNDNNRMKLFKLSTEDVDFDSTNKIFVNEMDAPGLGNSRKIVVEQIRDNESNVKYTRGNVPVAFDPDPISDYEYVNARNFVFDSYGNDDESDWAPYGQLSQGSAEKILFEGRILIQDGQYLLTLGRAYAYLGDVAEDGPQFYDALTDDISYSSALFSLKAERQVRVMGQINKVFNRSEGRNEVKRVIFSFNIDYIRGK